MEALPSRTLEDMRYGSLQREAPHLYDETGQLIRPYEGQKISVFLPVVSKYFKLVGERVNKSISVMQHGGKSGLCQTYMCGTEKEKKAVEELGGQYCPWRVLVRRSKREPFWVVKRLTDVHPFMADGLHEAV
jgi:hypothetical protein